MIKFFTISSLLLAGFAAAARAAVVPGGIPEIAPLSSVLPVSGAMMPTLSAMPVSPLLPAPTLPAPSLPVSGPKRLPGVWNHLPLELPAEAAVPVPAHDEYHLDWSFLDGGDGLLAVHAPKSPAPKPLPPAGAAAPLEFAAAATKSAGDAFFDHAAVLVGVLLPAR